MYWFVKESTPSIPGYGGYSSGILSLNKNLSFYAFIGSTAMFNALKSELTGNSLYPGAATDIRLSVNENYDWYDPVSLRSRILVAGGGASSEWIGSIGGHGGGLNGSRGLSDCLNDGSICDDVKTTGGTQTSGGIATPENYFKDVTSYGLNGTFGVSPQISGDMGGIGGSGYYSGASLYYAGSGGGGSSFISGHPGCIALKDSSSEAPSNSNIHYSRIQFTSTRMITGYNDMPLYFSAHSHGKGNKNRGAIRITILSYEPTDLNHNDIYSFYIFAVMICPI